MGIELVALGAARMHLEAPLILDGTPRGTRRIVPLTNIRLEGERLQASQRGTAAADWLTVGANGIGMLDVRYCVETDDGALVYVSYTGRVDLSGGTGAAPVYATPLYETGDPRYTWLNKIQAVAKGLVDESRTLSYEVYELR